MTISNENEYLKALERFEEVFNYKNEEEEKEAVELAEAIILYENKHYSFE